MGKFVPLSIPNFEGNEEKYVLGCGASGLGIDRWSVYYTAGRKNGGIFECADDRCLPERNGRASSGIDGMRCTAGRLRDRTNGNIYCGSQSCKISVCKPCFYGL